MSRQARAPGAAAGWAAGKPRAVTTTLPPLASADTRRIAELLLGAETPSFVVDRVCETAEGNPLYVEQLTAMLADQGLLVDGVWTGSDHAEIEIPETLQALVAARLAPAEVRERGAQALVLARDDLFVQVPYPKIANSRPAGAGTPVKVDPVVPVRRTRR